MQQPQQHGGTFHNIKEKIKHPLRHDTDTNTTFASHEQKKLQEGEPTIAPMGAHTQTTVQDPLLASRNVVNQPTTTGTTGLSQPSTHYTDVPRESEYQRKL